MNHALTIGLKLAVGVPPTNKGRHDTHSRPTLKGLWKVSFLLHNACRLFKTCLLLYFQWNGQSVSLKVDVMTMSQQMLGTWWKQINIPYSLKIGVALALKYFFCHYFCFCISFSPLFSGYNVLSFCMFLWKYICIQSQHLCLWMNTILRRVRTRRFRAMVGISAKYLSFIKNFLSIFTKSNKHLTIFWFLCLQVIYVVVSTFCVISRGCSTNSLVINWFIQWVSLCLPQLYGASHPNGLRLHFQL